MATFLRQLSPLKIVLVTLGLTLGLGFPVFPQPILDPLQPAASATTAALAPALQPPKNVEPPRIRPPAIPEKPITVQPNLLSSNKLVAVFPQFDGDGFFFVPSRTEAALGPATKVFQNAVIPFLSAIGFKNPATRFRPFDAHYQGREMPQADIETLAKITCGQWWIQNDKKAQQSCASLSEPSNPTLEANASFKTRTGMTLSQFKNTLERVEVEYFFTQERKVKATEHPGILDIPQKVPLEHTGIRVEGRKGEIGLFVTGRVINDDMTVTNVITIRPDAVLTAARKALMKIEGIRSVDKNLLKPVELLLLPYGGSGGVVDRPALKYVYRTALVADFLGLKGTFYLWLDAGTGEILQLVPTMGSATATGKTFNRDPSSLPATGLANFDIDPPVEDQYTLELSQVFSRLDEKGDTVFPPGDEVKESSEKFNLAQFSTDPTTLSVACDSGNNTKFAQVDLMATSSRYRATFNGAGPLFTFPRMPRTITINDRSIGCDALHNHFGFLFGVCDGYTSLTCPNDIIGDLNPAHDHTVIAHEFGHAFTQYQYGYTEETSAPQGERVASWCEGKTLEDNGMAPCPMPIRPDVTFHDFADAWSQVLEDTNCFGGWWGKNRGGPDFSLNCSHHSETGSRPRLSEVGMTFDSTEDRFPEHRKVGQLGEYSDMQIASAAFWAVREGLKKRDPAPGAILYLGRFVKTLATTGWLGQPAIPSSGFADRDIYRYLVEFEIKLVHHWSGSPGESTVNKVVSGFARAGIFMIPWGCLDVAFTASCVAPYASGADAAIDVDKDVVTRSDNPPTFHIWTGPIYKFDSTNNIASTATPVPCNAQYKIEISSDPTFPAATTKSITGTGLNTLASGCHGTWGPNASEWNAVKGASGQTSVYYRVTTGNTSLQVPTTCPASPANGDVRISTCPASGLFGGFEPPSVLVTPAVDTIPPSVPTNLSITAISSSQIHISWSPSTDNVGVTGYKIFRNGTEITAVRVFQFQDVGLSASTAYSYTVQAFDATGNVSMQSNNVSATTLTQASGGDVVPPGAPQGLQLR